MSKCPLRLLDEALRQAPTIHELSLRRIGLGHETLLKFLGLKGDGSKSGLRLVDVRGNKALVDLLRQKKYLPRYKELKSKVYIDFKYDIGKKQ